MENLPNLSEKYIEAVLDGRAAFLTDLARQYGRKTGEFKFFWAARGLEIFVDDMRFLMTVKFRGQIVCSTESMIFNDGDWWLIVQNHRENIESIVSRRSKKEAFLCLKEMFTNNPN